VFDLGAVCGVGGEFEVAFEVLGGFGPIAEIDADGGALFVPGSGGAVSGNEEVDDGERFVEVAAFEVDAAQVVEHAEEDLAFGGSAKERVVGGELDLGSLGGDFEAILAGEEAAVVIGVDVNREIAVAEFDEEMAGETDAADFAMEAAADFDVKEREGDGDAATLFEDEVEAAIARVVVGFAIAAEAEVID
jgi:hypothetical protein